MLTIRPLWGVVGTCLFVAQLGVTYHAVARHATVMQMLEGFLKVHGALARVVDVQQSHLRHLRSPGQPSADQCIFSAWLKEE